MTIPNSPFNELDRLKQLYSLKVLDTPEEPGFDEIVKMAAIVCDCPVALLSLVDEKRQWFKAKVGTSIEETPRDISFCSHAIQGSGLFQIKNAKKDKQFKDNPLVAGPPGVVFYAGQPIYSAAGLPLGTICVIDQKERSLTDGQKELLESLGKQASKMLELRLSSINHQHLSLLMQRNEVVKKLKEEFKQSYIEAKSSQERFLREGLRSILKGLKLQGGSFMPFFDDQFNWEEIIEVGDPADFSYFFPLHEPKSSLRDHNLCQHMSVIRHPIFLKDSMLGIMTFTCFKDARPEIAQEALSEAVPVFGELIAKAREEEKLQEEKRLNFHNSKLIAIGKLAAGIGHEINNPLTIIKGNTSLLMRNLDAEKEKFQLEHFQQIESSIDRIAAIVKGLRNFSRQDDSVNLNFSLNSMLQESLRMIQHIYQIEGVEVDYSCETDSVLKVKGNRGRIQQVIMNLLGNAKDAVEGAEIKRINISLGFAEGKAYIDISDTGPGVPESIAKDIFQPFFTTKAISKGTGIGLAISQTIAKEHSGDLVLRSKVRGGASFRLTLPAKKVEKKRIHGQEAIKLPKQANVPLANSKKILLVDDEEGIREVLNDLLSDMGFKVTTAENGKEAYLALTNSPQEFDIVISDINMPVMSGPDLLREAEGILLENGITFLFTTGGLTEDYPEALSSSCVSGFVQKPFSAEQIFLAIQKNQYYLKNKKAAQ